MKWKTSELKFLLPLTFSPISSERNSKLVKKLYNVYVIVQQECTECSRFLYINLHVRDESTMCLGHMISLSLLASHSVSPNCEYSMIALNIKINCKILLYIPQNSF